MKMIKTVLSCATLKYMLEDKIYGLVVDKFICIYGLNVDLHNVILKFSYISGEGKGHISTERG